MRRRVKYSSIRPRDQPGRPVALTRARVCLTKVYGAARHSTPLIAVSGPSSCCHGPRPLSPSGQAPSVSGKQE
ncbi:hypothetical protein CHLRE_14g627466v5 [Chlamydomonas reinhardtii]|uniref:Uncharacterized protein n=1 Tax=Chlamydomonas reinhardtii TaxID=3055 RepID=A0A2K3CYF8_CHLRE|nr:uncharacterized protein CHLRE_14g627466v5 [Chlamydomonas reinhardtii]PNW73314.1 hypothetical protein CHLRE_14g627466v5 [Chlamydomonas reinhardtii]